jgi:PAS domain S-box-containing protein
MDAFVKYSADHLFWAASDGRMLSCSQPLANRWQLTADGLSRVNVLELLASADGEPYTRQWLVKLFRTGGVTGLPVCCRPGNAQEERAELTACVQFDPFGVEQGVLCRLLFSPAADAPADSSLQMSDSFFKTVLNSISDAVLILDATDMRVLAANTVFLTESGQQEEDVIGKPCQAVAHGGTFARMQTSGICPLLETVSQERTAVAEHIFREEGKPVRVFEISTSPILDANGKVAQVVHVSRDVTARRRFEDEVRGLARRLLKSNQDLQQANEDLKNFAYIVSHDMRAPLVSIKGFAAELRRSLGELQSFLADQASLPEAAAAKVQELMDQDIAESINFIASSASRLDGMISAILQLARLGYREFQPERLDVEEMARGIFASLAHQLEQKQVTVEIEPLPKVTADRIALGQIFGNLIDNAVKYLDPSRPGKIRLTAEYSDEQTVFQVHDNGRGIAVKDQEKVFDLFKRVGRQDVAGEGMGLAYVKTLVRRLGGQLWCNSMEGEGTTFSFSLPAEQTSGGTVVEATGQVQCTLPSSS